jgi:hypothetical protein
VATDTEESEAERAAQSLLRTQGDLCDDPKDIAAYVLCEVGAEIVRALGRIEQRIDGAQRIAELEATIAEFERAIAEALARSEGPL